MKLSFCLKLGIHRSTKIYVVIVTGCGQTLQGLPKVMAISQFHGKDEPRSEVEFLHVVRHS